MSHDQMLAIPELLELCEGNLLPKNHSTIFKQGRWLKILSPIKTPVATHVYLHQYLNLPYCDENNYPC
jgi:hypothetical protein